MKRIAFLSVIIYVVLFFSAEITLAQADARYKNGKMIEISDLLAYEEMQDCDARRYLGTISAIQYTNKTTIRSFTLRTNKGAVKINISPRLYEQRIKTNDATNLPTLVARNKKVTVDTYACSSGRIILAMYILAGSEPEILG
ncbi:MAG TPA: hypothetical protein VGD05_03445 [Pyrinomonadaceae bacterium]|jgi:hypothetical protein